MSVWRSVFEKSGRLVGNARRRARQLATDRAGTVAIIVAFSIIPLIGAVGIATDTARGYLVKSRLQAAVDSAALAGGRVFYEQGRDSDIQQYFSANFPTGYMSAALQPLDITPDSANETITLEAQATIPTTFMQLLGQDTITVKASAQVKRRTDRLHVVLAIDMSGSMRSDMGDGYTRIEDAKSAALTLTSILFGSNTANDLLEVGLVPWAGKVNVTYDGTTYGYDSDGNALTGSDLLTTQTVTSYTHPMPAFENPVSPFQSYSSSSTYPWRYVSPNGGLTRTTLYYAHNSPVPLMDKPPTGWNGCVYARYAGDDSTAADEILLGDGSANNAVWPGWVPMNANIATRTAPYNVTSGDGVLVGSLFGVAQTDATSGNSVDMAITGTYTLAKQTSQSWSSGDTIYWDDINHVATKNSTTTYTTSSLTSGTYSVGSNETVPQRLPAGRLFRSSNLSSCAHRA